MFATVEHRHRGILVVAETDIDPMISKTIDGSSDVGARKILYVLACVFQPPDPFMLFK
jgi:hypothetical protein